MSVLHKFRKNKFCAVVPNIFGILTAFFPLHTKMHVISHAPSKKETDNCEIYRSYQRVGPPNGTLFLSPF